MEKFSTSWYTNIRHTRRCDESKHTPVSQQEMQHDTCAMSVYNMSPHLYNP